MLTVFGRFLEAAALDACPRLLQRLVTGADPGGPSGRNAAAQIAYLREDDGRVAYLSGCAPQLQGRDGGVALDPRLDSERVTTEAYPLTERSVNAATCS